MLVSVVPLLAQPVPLLVFVPGSAKQWVPDLAARGWELAVVPAGANDAGVRAIEAAVRDAGKRRAIDPLCVYLAGQAEGSAAVFYAVSRRPDLWAAALAAAGNPKAAIDSNRLFGANAQLVPLLWVVTEQEGAAVEEMRAKLVAAGFLLEPQPRGGMTGEQALEWLGAHRREEFPQKVDCETGNTEFGRCYWVEVTKLDPARRNDVLPLSRVTPRSGAALGLGGFGFKLDEPGPGLLVGWLPENYKGPLKLGDRIVAIGGTKIQDTRHYVEFMDQLMEEKQVGIVLQRGNERLRIESRIVLPRREENQTARVQAQFLPDPREMLIISRGAAELRLWLPAHWAPCPINWNGNDAGKADAGGCWLLSAAAPARRCQ